MNNPKPSKEDLEVAKEIAEWAIDEKLTPIINRCTEMIAEALAQARQEGREQAARIAFKFNPDAYTTRNQIPFKIAEAIRQEPQ